jgi:hypothetical protein
MEGKALARGEAAWRRRRRRREGRAQGGIGGLRAEGRTNVQTEVEEDVSFRPASSSCAPCLLRLRSRRGLLAVKKEGQSPCGVLWDDAARRENNEEACGRSNMCLNPRSAASGNEHVRDDLFVSCMSLLNVVVSCRLVFRRALGLFPPLQRFSLRDVSFCACRGPEKLSISQSNTN